MNNASTSTKEPAVRNNDGLGLYSNVAYLDTVLYIVAGVCSLILLISILWFVLLCKLGKFSDNPRYRRRHYMQTKYQSMSNGTTTNVVNSFNMPVRRLSTPEERLRHFASGNNQFDYDEIDSSDSLAVRKPLSKSDAINRPNLSPQAFTVKTRSPKNVSYPLSSTEGGNSNPVDVSDDLCSPSDSYYTAHSVYLTPVQPVVNGDIFFRPCREQLPPEALTSAVTAAFAGVSNKNLRSAHNDISFAPSGQVPPAATGTYSTRRHNF